jgi:Secretion system C-terminal sorting domain
MRNISLLIVLFAWPVWLQAQSNPGSTWVMGTSSVPGEPGYGQAILRFGQDTPTTELTALGMNFEATVASMTDSTGQLLFYTNGCTIASGNGVIMENGDGINPGPMHDWTCPTAGYTAPFGAVPLPVPNHPSMYYLLHLGVNYESGQGLSYGPFYYTLIDMEANGGLGRVISKNNILLDQRNLAPFSVTRHANGRDWWALVPEYGTGRYHTFVVRGDRVLPRPVQTIGEASVCRYVGTGAFSLQGDRYARQHHCGLFTFDFDRCSGLLSAPRYFEFPSRAFGGGGVAFSPDGNRVLTTTQLSVMGVDLRDNEPKLDTVIDFIQLLGTSLYLMQYGDDGRLYFSTIGRSKYLHVAETPNDADIGFRFKGLSLPVLQVRSLPNLPNYQLGALDRKCVPDDFDDLFASHIRITPNPATQFVRIQSTSTEFKQIRLFDAAGRLVMERSFSPVYEFVLPTQLLSAGIYQMAITGIKEENAVQKLLIIEE